MIARKVRDIIKYLNREYGIIATRQDEGYESFTLEYYILVFFKYDKHIFNVKFLRDEIVVNGGIVKKYIDCSIEDTIEFILSNISTTFSRTLKLNKIIKNI